MHLIDRKDLICDVPCAKSDVKLCSVSPLCLKLLVHIFNLRPDQQILLEIHSLLLDYNGK